MTHKDDKAQTARGILARADEQRNIAHWAYNMMVTLRLGRPVKLAEMKQRGPFGRKREYLYELDDRMPGPAVDALYQALQIVRNEANSAADALEAQVRSTPAEESR